MYAKAYWNHFFFRSENFRVRKYYMYMDIHVCQSLFYVTMYFPLIAARDKKLKPIKTYVHPICYENFV